MNEDGERVELEEFVAAWAYDHGKQFATVAEFTAAVDRLGSVLNEICQ